MKRRIVPFFVTLIMLCAVISSGCQKQNELTVVRLNEVVHSIFYVPQYIALEKGFFEEQGLSIELDVGQGADKSMTALISGHADIALLGTEAGIYVYNEGRENHAVAFAQLTQRAGNFLVSREKEENFQWTDLKGRTIIGGRGGGMPQMILEYILKQNGLELGTDVEMITNLQFTSTAGAFIGGEGDYTAEFDPSAYSIEKEGRGYVVASMGLDSGKVPYTVYMATKEYIEKNPEVIQKFTNAIYEAQQWADSHTAAEIAEVIVPHFPDMELADLIFMIERYDSQETWNKTPVFDPDGFDLIQDIMEMAGELSQRVPYEDMINTEFALKATQ